MYEVTYNGNARAIYDVGGMAKRNEKNKELIAKGKEEKITNKTVYKAGTVFCGVELPTGVKVKVKEKDHPELIKKVQAHIAAAKLNEKYESPYSIKKAK